MARIHETKMSLRFFGDDLDPDEITSRLGCQPSVSRRTGEVWTTPRGVERVARTGSWLLKIETRHPGDLDLQVAELLASLSVDLSVWDDLTMRFDADVFCGLFMRESNEGLSLSAKTMKNLGSRSLPIGFDIYDPGEPN
jgi:Domain of unknown function (DUF4279)